MFDVRVDRIHAIVEYVLGGRVLEEEMQQCMGELRHALFSLQGRDVQLVADVRGFRPMSPEVAETLREIQVLAMELGVRRIAEIIESDIVALQLKRVARESGAEKILRRFPDEDTALEWLRRRDGARP